MLKMKLLSISSVVFLCTFLFGCNDDDSNDEKTEDNAAKTSTDTSTEKVSDGTGQDSDTDSTTEASTDSGSDTNDSFETMDRSHLSDVGTENPLDYSDPAL